MLYFHCSERESMRNVLITGGAGYIGSHCTLDILKNGDSVCVFDNLSSGHIEIIDKFRAYENFSFVQGDLKNYDEINNVFKEKNFGAVVHFAGYIEVGESVLNPQKYYYNNILGSLNLFDAMLENNIKNIVFSSTAAVYGNPEYTPIDEKHPKKPINPYGKTKLFIEEILSDYDTAYGLKSIKLRYFNVVGANSEGFTGEWHNPETHLIPNILKSSLGEQKEFNLFGTDYETKDGTCIRDYVNVEDLTYAHVLAMEYLLNNHKSEDINLGTNNGNSVKETFEICEKVTGKKIPLKICPRRAGDSAILVADNKKAKEILNWSPQKTLEQSIQTAYNWEKIKIN